MPSGAAGPVPRMGVCALLLAATLAACGTGPRPPATDRPQVSALPGDLTAYVDQRRSQRSTREVFVRLVEDGDQGDHEVTVTRAHVVSDRFDPVTWTGEETFTRETDLEFDLPAGRCGEGSDAEVELTYRVDGGPVRVSRTTATDRYGAVGLFLDRDCVTATVAAAADLEVGSPAVQGRGRSAVLTLPLTWTPRGDPAAAPVRVVGFGDTTLFRVADAGLRSDRPDRPDRPSGGPVLDAGPGAGPQRLGLRLVPGRCDPHALAEDKVGTLVPAVVRAPGLGDDAVLYLPVDAATRADLRAYFAATCGY